VFFSVCSQAEAGRTLRFSLGYRVLSALYPANRAAFRRPHRSAALKAEEGALESSRKHGASQKPVRSLLTNDGIAWGLCVTRLLSYGSGFAMF